jgi:hypothetical protein
MLALGGVVIGVEIERDLETLRKRGIRVPGGEGVGEIRSGFFDLLFPVD